MTVKVEFPDGEVRDMPSHSRKLPSREIGTNGRPPTFVEEPDFDPDWRFESAIGGKWFANPR